MKKQAQILAQILAFPDEVSHAGRQPRPKGRGPPLARGPLKHITSLENAYLIMTEKSVRGMCVARTHTGTHTQEAGELTTEKM